MKNIKLYGSILLEITPILIGIISLFIGMTDIFLYSIAITVGVYVIFGWYIFKTDEYRFKDIVFTEVAVIFFLLPPFAGFIYKILAWPGGNDILRIAILGCLALLIISIIWFFKHRDFSSRKLLGFNILARAFIIIFLANLFGMIMDFIE